MNSLPVQLSPLSQREIDEAQERWSKTTFKGASGQWWQYLAKKVIKVFPDLNLPGMWRGFVLHAYLPTLLMDVLLSARF